MSGQNRNHYLIGHILSLLHLLQENHLDMDRLMLRDEWERAQSLPEMKDCRASYEIIKFMDEMPGGFLIYYADGDEEIIYTNKALLRIFQCDTIQEFRELTGNSFRGLVHPDDVEEVEKSIEEQIAGSKYDLDYVEYRIIGKDGGIRWIEDYGHFVRNETGRDVFYVFLTDATERKNRRLAEKASLIEAYDKERALINQEYLRRLEVIKGLSVNYESIFYVNLDDNEILPYRLSARSGPIFDEKFQMRAFTKTMAAYADAWVHPEDREAFLKELDPKYICDKLKEQKTYYTNYRVLSGEEVQYLQFRIVNVGARSHISQIVIGYRRVDEELQHEMEQKQLLAEALDNATRSVAAKNTFLSNMSHDMRTPLNAVFGFTALAKKNRGNPEAVDNYLTKAETAGQQLLELIDKVLEFVQIESGEAKFREEKCDLCTIIKEVYDRSSPKAVEKNVNFSLYFGGVMHRNIYSDKEKLKQMLLYLVNNAIAYTKRGGSVSITAVEKEELPNQCAVYQLIVEDTGIGISEEYLERVFEPFVREKNTTHSGIHGVGLGLTIVKNIVDTLGGTIEVKSDKGKGSIFTITLRFRIETQSHPKTREMAFPDFQVRNQKILLVEDNEINLEIETEILEELGFTVDIAVNGSVAVDKMKEADDGKYDLILMDIQMPVMDGWQAAKTIRRLHNPTSARIPIIALSANIFESDIRKSIECGMDAHISKPLDVFLLLETIEKIAKR